MDASRTHAPYAQAAPDGWVFIDRPLSDLEALYAGHFHGLSVQLYAFTGDLGVAQELVQEAFARAIPRWSKIVTYDDPLAWVRRIRQWRTYRWNHSTFFQVAGPTAFPPNSKL